jgi:hypothetical protein
MQKKQWPYYFITQNRSIVKQVRFDNMDIACVSESKLSTHICVCVCVYIYIYIYTLLKVSNKIEHILLHYKGFNGCNERTIYKECVLHYFSCLSVLWFDF